MASFYKADDEWNQGDEIPLFNMSEFGEAVSMSTCYLNDTLPKTTDKLIYVYDFFKMWSFYVEVIEITSESLNEAKIIMSIGEIPEEAPKKEFIAEKDENSFEDDFSEDDFDSLDDYDFTEY